MKRLYILRHAQAAPAGGFADYDRPLTDKGLNDAHRLGQRMRDKNYQPACVFCSPALRTSETLREVISSLNTPSIDYTRIIYDGGKQDLLKLVQTANDDHKSLMLVAHNPSIHQLAFELAEDRGSLINELSTGYPPATLSVLDCPVEKWTDLKTSQNRLIDLLLAD